MITRRPRARARILIAVLLSFGVASACSPQQVMAYMPSLSADQATSISRHTMTCHEAVDAIVPSSAEYVSASTRLRAWFHRIVKRESGGRADAKNRSSTASGCLQELVVHAPRYARLGLSWAHDRFRAWANVTVGLDLYCEQGATPWRLTSSDEPLSKGERRALCGARGPAPGVLA